MKALFLGSATLNLKASGLKAEDAEAKELVGVSVALGAVEAGVKLKLVLGTDGVKLNVGAVVGILVTAGLEEGAVALISVI